MNIDQQIRELCRGKDAGLVVCCWDVGMPRNEPWIVKAFLPSAGETPKESATREQEARKYAASMQDAFRQQRRPFTTDEYVALVLAPGMVARELDYFVADATGSRV